MPLLIGHDLEMEPDVLEFARLGAVGRRGPPLSELGQQAVNERAIEQRHDLPWADEQTCRESTPCVQWAWLNSAMRGG